MSKEKLPRKNCTPVTITLEFLELKTAKILKNIFIILFKLYLDKHASTITLTVLASVQTKILKKKNNHIQKTLFIIIEPFLWYNSTTISIAFLLTTKSNL